MSAALKHYFGGVQFGPRLAYLLERQNLTEFRTAIRGRDLEVDQLLREIRQVAMSYEASANASEQRKATQADAPLKEWWTPAEIANQLRLTPEAVRLAIRQKRLPGSKVDGRIRVSTADFQIYRERRNH